MNQTEWGAVDTSSSWDQSSQPAWLTNELFSQKIQPLLSGVSTSASDHGLECPADMRAGSARATDRILDTGRRLRSWLGFLRAPHNAPVAASRGSKSVYTMAKEED